MDINNVIFGAMVIFTGGVLGHIILTKVPTWGKVLNRTSRKN